MKQIPILFQKYPHLSQALSHVPLGQWPTDVHLLPTLSEELGVNLWIKRDDRSAVSYGGNKVRKLEFLLGKALKEGAKTIVTVGGIGSSHIIATGIFAKLLGLETKAVVVPQPVTEVVLKHLAAIQNLNLTLIPCSSRALVPFYLQAVKMAAQRPMMIGPGGSSPLGTLGYVSAGLELGEQVLTGAIPEPDAIFIALGSGGTLAGLALGCSLAGLNSKIFGVRVVERYFINESLVRILIARTSHLLRDLGVTMPQVGDNFRLIHDHFGKSYGQPTIAGTKATQLALTQEGLTLDPTYTAKTLAACLDSCKTAEKQKNIIFWNTYNSQPISKASMGGLMNSLPPKILDWIGAANM